MTHPGGRAIGSLFCALALLLPASAGAAPRPATFYVGAATLSIKPAMPVYDGGFGESPPITVEHDPLQVRAIYVSDGRHSAAFATVDCQAEFAAYQDGPQYGITAARNDAAAAVPGLSAASIIVQGTHSHAAPTLEGIWGPVPPAYLKQVHDQTVSAIVAAARAARPANLQWGTIDAPFIDNVDLQQTDSYQGWSQDGQISVLRAVAPGSGETIASYVNVPAHPDIVNGAGLKIFSADYFGFVRARLDKLLGGTNVVGPATLGREETPVQVDGIAAMQWFGGLITELSLRALGDARWITQGHVQSVTRRLYSPGANPLLLAIISANHLPASGKQAFLDQTGLYPANRADTPPWQTGNILGTDLTAVRIGRLAYLSMPGEPFPEVRAAIDHATTGADMTVALSKGQDDFGYFYPAWAYGFNLVYPSDFLQYNVAPQLGDQVILDQISNLKALGFTSDYALSTPLPTRLEQIARPAVQGMASPASGAVGARGTFSPAIEAIWSGAQLGDANRALAGLIHIDYGDGTSADVKSQARIAHPFAPGHYTVTLSAHDKGGRGASWEIPVVALPRLTVEARLRDGVFSASSIGGSGTVLAWHWRFDRGPDAYGPRVRAPDGVRHARLTITDSSGSRATASL